MHPYSGTMVIKPTERSWMLLEKWRECGLSAPRFATDEATLGEALCSVPDLIIAMLPDEACGGPNTKNAIIGHPERTGKRSRFVMIRHSADRIFRRMTRTPLS